MNAPAALAALVGMAVATAVAEPGHAQMHQADGFDASRAMLEGTPLFDPYYVEETESLAGALRERVVGSDTPLLVIHRGDATLALLTYQMAYHHVAQGTLAGEPWLVAF